MMNVNIDLPKLIGETADYRRDNEWDTRVTIQGCCWPQGYQLPQLIATNRADGAIIVDSVGRFRVNTVAR